MKSDERIEALEQRIDALGGDLAAIRRVIENVVPALLIEKGERDRQNLHKEMLAVAALPVAERLEKLRELTPYQVSDFWRHCGLSLDDQIAMLKQCDVKNRTDLIERMTDDQRTDLGDAIAAVAPRIEARLAVGKTQRVESSRLGADYQGVHFDAFTKHLELRERWLRRLKIDFALQNHVADGTIIVRDLSEAESRLVAQRERRSVLPQDRAVLDPGKL